jgi:N-methylhydantoinase A
MRIGADIGGTFTDVVLVDDATGDLRLGKVLTTSSQPDDAVILGISQVVRGNAADVSHVVHGTTLFTNALIERKGALTALITTKGFRDAIEIGREHRYDMYDLRLRRPAPIARRRHRFEIDERVLADGTARKRPSKAEIETVAARLRELGIEAVAVCLLNSYLNPEHELLVGNVLRDVLPGVAITLSSEIAPEIREFERSSTALCNVYVKRIAEAYLSRLEARVRETVNAGAGLFVMQSNGGLLTADQAAEAPIRLVESGPAAGALAAAHYGNHLGFKDVLSFDMGGTTAKACLIVDGEPLLAPEFEVDRQYLFKKGSGLPVKVPVIEMIEIGTGGGSIAEIDALGRLKVGPQSAGSAPGPVCYGRGGEKPTVTDADLVLGYLDPKFFLGGEMELDLDGAGRAILESIGRPLGLDTLKAAWGVHQLANEAMASAARIHAIERGREISHFPMFAFGGAGPVHAYGVAKILKLSRVIYPFGAGVMSAVGFLTAPLSFDFVRSNPVRLELADWDSINALIADMESEGRKRLSASLSSGGISFRRTADMRYRKQGFDISVPVPAGQLSAAKVPEILAEFERVYEQLYGHTIPDTPVDVISWRVVASGPRPDLRLPSGGSSGGVAAKGRRPIYIPDFGMRDVPVYDRYQLASGTSLSGPAIIEERESTVVINGPGKITVDPNNNLFVDLEGSP